MLKLTFTLFEDILTEGVVHLKVERKFKWMRMFDLLFFQEDQHLLTLSTSLKGLKTLYEIPYNQTGMEMTIETDRRMTIGGEALEFKVNRGYPFEKKYAEVFINSRKVGELRFEKKGMVRLVLEFVPCEDVVLKEEDLFKIAVLTALNCAGIDGSE